VVAVGAGPTSTWELTPSSQLRLHVPAPSTPARIKILIARVTAADIPAFITAAKSSPTPADLSALTHGGPPRWSRKLTTTAKLSTEKNPYVIDRIPLPTDNPWKAQMRIGGFDFFKDGRRAALCTWDGDVWLADGLG